MFAVWGPWISGRAFDFRSRGLRLELDWDPRQYVIAQLAQSEDRKALNLGLGASRPRGGRCLHFLISPITYNIVQIHSNPTLKKVTLVSLKWSSSCCFEI